MQEIYIAHIVKNNNGSTKTLCNLILTRDIYDLNCLLGESIM